MADSSKRRKMWHMGEAKAQTRGVSRCGLVIYMKRYLKAKEEL